MDKHVGVRPILSLQANGDVAANVVLRHEIPLVDALREPVAVHVRPVEDSKEVARCFVRDDLKVDEHADPNGIRRGPERSVAGHQDRAIRGHDT